MFYFSILFTNFPFPNRFNIVGKEKVNLIYFLLMLSIAIYKGFTNIEFDICHAIVRLIYIIRVY